MKIAAEIKKDGTIINLSHWEKDADLLKGLVDVTDANPPAKIGDKIVKGKVVPQLGVNLNLDMYAELMAIAYKGFKLHQLKDMTARLSLAIHEPILLFDTNNQLQALSKADLGDIALELALQEQEILKKYHA